MIRRLYVHNYRCFENFELSFADNSTLLLLGKNGSGKTTIGLVLELLQKIARGTSRVGELVKPKDLAHGRSDVPMRIECEVELAGNRYVYVIAFEYPPDFKELRVFEEKLTINGKNAYARTLAGITWANHKNSLGLDWHVVYLPIVQERSNDLVTVFKKWLSELLVLRPVPALITGASNEESLAPSSTLENFGEWFSGLIAESPAAYLTIDRFLKDIMPDLHSITNPVSGDTRSMFVDFKEGKASTKIPFADLSDGEKCFIICATVVAANEAYGPLFCYWDEPDAYLAPDEIGQLMTTLRRAFNRGGQLVVSSHNPEAVSRFSDDSTLYLHRRSHVEPTTPHYLSSLRSRNAFIGDIADALVRGDIEP